MRVATPLETVWPAAVALALLLVGAVWSRSHLRLPARALAWVAVAVALRLWGLPVFEAHVYDGHEAEYYDLFVGTRSPTRGGPVLYPAMQWFWWGLGKILPHDPRVPVVLMAFIGTAGAGILAAALGLLSDRRAGWAAAWLLALHPVHVAWSSSAYNVVLPWALGALALWCGVQLLRLHRPHAGLALLGAAAGALAVATRIESGLWGVLVVALAVAWWPPRPGRGSDGVAARLRGRLPLLVPALVGGMLAMAAAWPILFPGELPGAGERALSFAINRGHLAPLAPLGVGSGLVLVIVGGAAAATRWPAATFVLLLASLATHLLFATFDDYGDRHGLLALPGLVFAVAAGASALADRSHVGFRGAALALWLGGMGLAGAGLIDLRERYYGAEERFADRLAQEPWASLPRWTPEDARTDCGWVAEDPRVAAEPVASHFNLLDPLEAAALRGSGGCLRWCADVQDWRWSSRGVRDRALRLSHLYTLSAVAVVREPASGYSCLVFEVGARTCCHVGRDGQRPPTQSPAPSSTVELDARADPGAPGLP